MVVFLSYCEMNSIDYYTLRLQQQVKDDGNE